MLLLACLSLTISALHNLFVISLCHSCTFLKHEAYHFIAAEWLYPLFQPFVSAPLRTAYRGLVSQHLFNSSFVREMSVHFPFFASHYVLDARVIRYLCAGGSKMWTGNNTAVYSSQTANAAYC